MKPVRNAGVLALAIVLSSITAFLAFPPAGSGAAPVTVLVHAPIDDVLAIAPGTAVVEAYDSFVLVKAAPEVISSFRDNGIAVDSYEESQWIGLESVRFDTRKGEPAVSADLRTITTSGPSLNLVHFIGPVKPTWLKEIRDAGADVLQYIPTYAFLVSMDSATHDSVRAMRFVDWVGPYQPAFKVRSTLSGVSGITTVQILTVDEADIGSVVQTLSARGLARVSFDASGPGILSTFHVGPMGVVRARLDAAILPAIARLDRVMWVEPWELPHVFDSSAQALLQTGLPPSDSNARRLWANGLTGIGETITLGDTGIDFDNNFFRESTSLIQKGQGGDPTGTVGPLSIYNTTDTSRRKLVRYMLMSPFRGIDPWTGGDPEAHKDSINGGGCPSGHGTSTSGNAGGSDATIGTSLQDGMALDAKLIIQDIGSVGPTTSCPTPLVGDILSYIPDDYDDLFGPAYANNSRIHSNSWGGSDNGYDLQAMMVDRFVWNHPDMAIFFASGNGGPGLFSVGSPGTSKSTLTIGGANEFPNQEQVASLSSRGPTSDGRLKPDIMTFFAGTTASSSGNPTDDSNNGATTQFGGTSHSTPLAAGMAALVRQYFNQGYYPSGTAVPANGFNPSAALVKALLAASARKMTGNGANNSENKFPNDAQGWGRLVLDDALYVNPATEGPRKLWVVDQASGVSTGQAVDYKIRVNSNAAPLRIVMAYSDYPASPNANPSLVNNLNLQVTSPTGAVYKGNVFGIFVVGQSVPNSGSFDTRNPMEGVIVTSPAVGEWSIRVEGANVPSGPQGFGLVAVADLDLGFGDIRLDKRVYSESDTIRIEVHDANAATVTANLRSTIETTPEAVTLTQTAPGSGLWRGQINTAFGDPVADGALQVSEGGSIEAVYSDVNPGHDAIATASVDASPPAISNVRAEDITNSGATIKWTTSEAADSKVYYGTNPASLTSTAFDIGLVATHAIPLGGLQTDTVYYYDVESADGLGHGTRDTSGGAHYRFRTTALGDILLVIGDGTFPSDRIPMYRDALARSAWSYNEWQVAASGDPPLSELQKYKVVIWQTGLEQYPQLSDAQRGLVKSYLDAGGRLFLSSHDLAWSLCSTTQNPYYSAARCSWFRSAMKVTWMQDPATWTQDVGIAGDPISGTYTAGVTYVGHRSGGYGDEVRNLCGTTGGQCIMAGATLTYVWRDSGGSSTPDNVADKWQSTGPNGTAGVGVWGGSPTKAAVFYFEFTGINFVSGVVSDPSRTDIANRTIIWLIGRDHPAVRVRAPNGGETITTNTATIQWTRQAFGGTNVASQALYYSNNSGQAWTRILPDPLATDTSYTWDVSSLPNGGRYRVRVVAQDDGSPVLAGSDASDADFAINRTGGDTLGPLIWSGSLSLVPNPIVNNGPVTFRATADDTVRGNSVIGGAELFEGATPGVTGTGLSMSASDGAFTSVVEDIVRTTTASWGTGTHCFWVHARDVVGNWGPYESRCTTITSTGGIDTLPPMVATVNSGSLSGGTFNDVRVAWSSAPDEGQIGGTTVYRLFRSTTLAGTYTQVGPDVPAGGGPYSLTDTGAGDQAPSPTYFYRVETVDAAGNTANSTGRAGKFSIDLPAGVSLVSLPLIQSDSTLTVVLQTLFAPVALRGAWTFDGCTQAWFTYSSARPLAQSTLRTIGRGAGVYVDLAAADRFSVAGILPGTTQVTLCGGWNLVSFPSFASMTAGQVMTATGASAVLAFDATAVPGKTRTMAAGDLLQSGRGYWIAVALATNWNVPGQ